MLPLDPIETRTTCMELSEFYTDDKCILRRFTFLNGRKNNGTERGNEVEVQVYFLQKDEM